MFNFPVKTPRLFKWLFPKYTWDNYMKTCGEKVLYLTFDDGPTPGITPWVLEQLEHYGAKATFFLVGNNVDRHPELVTKITAANHTIGNHTYDHLNGWATATKEYIDNIEKTEKTIKVDSHPTSIPKKFFRPPYGKIKNGQASALMALGYKIVMYDILAWDWDEGLSGERCVENVVKNAKSGSIIVFHDSIKAEKNLRECLPQVLEYYKRKGYKFAAL